MKKSVNRAELSANLCSRQNMASADINWNLKKGIRKFPIPGAVAILLMILYGGGCHSPSASGTGKILNFITAPDTGSVGFNSIQVTNVASSVDSLDFTLDLAQTGQSGNAINVSYNYISDEIQSGSSTVNLTLPDSIRGVLSSIKTGSIFIQGKTKRVLTGSMSYGLTTKLPSKPPHHQ